MKVDTREGTKSRVTGRRRPAVVVACLLAASGASASCALVAGLGQFNGYNDALDASEEVNVDAPAGFDAPPGDREPPPDTGVGDIGVDAFDVFEGGSTLDRAAPPDSPVADASDADVPTGDAPTTDAPTADAPTADANSLLGNSFCSRHVDQATVLCADYDQGRTDTALTFPIGGTWALYQVGGSVATINRADFAPGSPLASLLVNTACTGVGPGCAPATQDQFTYIATAPRGVVLSFALKIPNFDVNAGDVNLVVVSQGAPAGWSTSLVFAGAASGNNNELLTFRSSDGGGTFAGTPFQWPAFTDTCAAVSDGGPSDGGDGGINGGAATDSGDGDCSTGWINVALTDDLVGSTAACEGSPCATLTYNGANALTLGAVSTPIPASISSSVSILIGANYIGAPAQPMELEYDNVLVEALP